jgi:hypothetical protein
MIADHANLFSGIFTHPKGYLMIQATIHKGYRHSTTFWGFAALIFVSSFNRSNHLLSEDRPSLSMGSSSPNGEKS